MDLRDATGESLHFDAASARIVSLVPSETETVCMLGGASRIVGRTDYCVEPRAEVTRIPSVGGTKDARVADIIALAPDVVLANQEENTQEIVRGLRSRGVRVHVSFPKTVNEASALIDDIATMIGVNPDANQRVLAMRAALRDAEQRRAAMVPVRVFCPIWMDPLMTIHADTFISDVIDLAGGANIFADRTRRYPLAADLGLRPALPPERIAGRDVRYPRVTLDELVARAPDVVLLPDEPHPFTERDADVFRALDIPAAHRGRVTFIDGKDLCWYSPRMTDGIARVANAIRA